ncbi:hypothetical protein SOVF_153200 [Spinacia oleracea]|nr:hypothetical protein SOVF_153200 [Spinacia oleracea]
MVNIPKTKKTYCKNKDNLAMAVRLSLFSTRRLRLPRRLF